MRVILELVMVAIIAFCAWSGRKKGMIMGIGGIVLIVVSLYGGSLLSNTFSHDVVPALRPFLSGYTETVINREENGVLADLGWDDSDLSVEDLLKENPDQKETFARSVFTHVGLSEGVAKELSADALEYADNNEVSIRDAVVEVFCVRTAYVAALLLFFLLLYIALTVIVNITNFSYKLPNREKTDRVVGLILGLVTGVLLCSVIGWFLHYTGAVIPQETISKTVLTRLFSRLSIVSIFLGA